ncbi:GMC family oxidoreductase [Amycolatopsis sp. 195334CR]|uniref:GMC family oxidoreductase n=1 Tax=Amycolatopsis sp. 195334CR TaxID=2814588 RepID=UPI001A8ED38C|nr:FAD-dependent oxidoreductase [Amycolatopsis sp. 195334CR]MBN6038849.1 GMC family oxidoreductase N-terminal domain-containing protein [Amycolatopsis sp. 195334CR]
MDVIVVGAGSAGSVVARRLADAGAAVRLLEAGGPDGNPAIHDPSRAGELWHGPEDWDHHTVPQPHAANRRLHLPRGKVLGGSHALNAMIWVRGAPADYDGWDLPGWRWPDVRPVFERIEKDLLEIVPNEPLHPIQQSIVEAAVQTGLEFNPDYHGDRLDGVSVQRITLRDGRRLNTWIAYAQPIAGQLTVHTGALVHRLLFDGTRVVGVLAELDGQLERVLADQVVLAAGALASPAILLRSGVGPADELAALGIDVVADLPGVGRNLHDHLLSPVIFATDRREVEPPSPGRSVTQTHLFWRSRPGLAVPDTQPIHFSVPMYESWMTGPETGFSLMAGMVSPRSRGSLKLSGPEPGDEPLIDLDALADPADFESLVASVEQCREIGRAPALAEEWGARELYPEPGDDVREYVRRTAITYHHQVGTCRMGTGETAVVDPELVVHGLEGLRVADASVLPKVTTGNTNAPAVLVGEQAARFMLGR